MLSSDEAVRLELTPILDIRVSEEFRESFVAAISFQKKIVIDASGVERMSTPCVQVILAARKAIEEAGLECALYQPSEVFVDAFNELGLFPELMKWKVET